jgi:hypothetical protein
MPSIRVAFGRIVRPKRLADPVRKRLSLPWDVIVDDEASIVSQLAHVDLLVSMGFSAHMAEAAPRLRLFQRSG